MSANIETLLKLMSSLESRGNKDTNHKVSDYGVQAGDTAIGEYGLMPNTAKEMANRRRLKGDADEFDKQVLAAPNDDVQEMLQKNPMGYKRYNEDLAVHLLNKTGDDLPTAATGWLYGHNKSPEDLKQILDDSPEYMDRIQKALSTFPSTKKALGK